MEPLFCEFISCTDGRISVWINVYAVVGFRCTGSGNDQRTLLWTTDGKWHEVFASLDDMKRMLPKTAFASKESK